MDKLVDERVFVRKNEMIRSKHFYENEWGNWYAVNKTEKQRWNPAGGQKD